MQYSGHDERRKKKLEKGVRHLFEEVTVGTCVGGGKTDRMVQENWTISTTGNVVTQWD